MDAVREAMVAGGSETGLWARVDGMAELRVSQLNASFSNTFQHWKIVAILFFGLFIGDGIGRFRCRRVKRWRGWAVDCRVMKDADEDVQLTTGIARLNGIETQGAQFHWVHGAVAQSSLQFRDIPAILRGVIPSNNMQGDLRA